MRKTLRQFGRRLALDALAQTAQWRGDFRLAEIRPCVQLVLLHHIKPHEAPRFGEFLEWMHQHFHPVSWSEAVDRITTQSIDRPYVSYSFDDGLQDNLVAGKILRDHGAAGCFFVCPGIVGEKKPDVLETYCRQRMLFRETDQFLDWDGIEQLVNWGHEIGNHSYHHYYMMQLEDDQFREEVQTAQEKLKQQVGAIQHFAWPYGRFFHFKRRWLLDLGQLGFASCASGERGSHGVGNTEDTPPGAVCLRRDSLDMSWPLRHSKYFISRSVKTPLVLSDVWPESGAV